MITINFTISDEIVGDVIDSLCDTYGYDEEMETTKAQYAKDMIKKFVKDCYVNWKSQKASIEAIPIAQDNAEIGIN